MTEAQVGFLYNIATAIPQSGNNENNTILKSYYLMRCKDITRGYGLPNKHFSSITRCPNCCIEWNNNTEINVRSIKLSSRQKQRLKSKKKTHSKKEYVRSRRNLLMSNKVEQICSFCKNSTVKTFLKPEKQSIVSSKQNDFRNVTTNENTKQDNKLDIKKLKKRTRKAEAIVYSNAMDVFSMQNKKNTLASTFKVTPKVIKNNKKKKDRFAGLCQKAVMTSAKLKEEKNKSNALSLFLKPSS